LHGVPKIQQLVVLVLRMEGLLV